MKKNNFWKNKTVMVTGHTGFKGSWLTLLLKSFEEIISNEKKLTLYAENKLRNNEYYPGFFITIGKKIL